MAPVQVLVTMKRVESSTSVSGHAVSACSAITQLCEHLTATQTRYPGTDLTLRYEVKTRP